MKHKVKVIPKEEILANRSNAYEFIDFDKQEFSKLKQQINFKEREKNILILLTACITYIGLMFMIFYLIRLIF